MVKKLSIGAILWLCAASASYAADMFGSSSEVSTHDAHCTQQERESGRCDRDKRYTENSRPPQVYIDNSRRYDRPPAGEDRYEDRRDRRYDDRSDRRDYDDRRDGRGYDGRRYDDRRDGRRDDDRRYRPDPNWKEKHDIRTEDEFERQRRKDQEYYDKY
jgi:hypothetical protein